MIYSLSVQPCQSSVYRSSTNLTEVGLSRSVIVQVLWRASQEELTKNPRDKCDIQERWIGVAVNELLWSLFSSGAQWFQFTVAMMTRVKALFSKESLWVNLWVCGSFLLLKTIIPITFLKREASFRVLASQSCCCPLQLSKDQKEGGIEGAGGN